MADNQDITLKVFVFDAQGQFRGGTVDVEFRHRTLSEHGTQRGLDASREINIAGLRRTPTGDYQITVTPTDVFKPESQFVNIPASGFATMEVRIDREPDPAFVVKGAVRTAAGAPFTNGLVRAIHQTASGAVLLGESRTNNQGNYLTRYSSELVTGAINLTVQVFDENGKLLAQSDPTAPAKREEVVNLTLPAPEPLVTAYRVDGNVSRPDKTMVVDGMVQVFDVSIGSEQLLGKAITDGTGHFKITYLGKPFEARGGADLIVRVFDSQGRVLATSAVIRKARPAEQVSLVIDDKPPVEQKPFVVSGTVREANGRPVAGVIVRAFDRDLRSEEPLGNATADSQGNYEIHYGPEQFRRADKEGADLIARVYNDKGEELAASAIIFNAKPQEVVDLTIDLDKLRPESEYERYLADLAPLLEGVPLAQLTEGDITFLTGETRIDRQHLASIVSSTRWSAEIGVPPAAIYGLQRVGLSTNLPELLAESEQRQRAALESAISSNIIPLSLKDDIDSILARLHYSFVQRIIQRPGPNGQLTIGRVLARALPSPETQEAFVSASIRHSQSGESTDSFWDKLRADARFSPDDIESIRFTVQLGALTSNHPPLIEALQKKRQAGELTSLRDLARLDAADWGNLIQQTANDLPASVPGKDTAEKIRNFAATIASSVELQFPTAVIASRLSRDQGFDMPHKEAVATFLDEHSDFDFASTNIKSYLALHKETAFKGVNDQEGFTGQLETMQRVAHVAPRYYQIQALISKGFGSARDIARFSREQFLADYAVALGGPVETTRLHEAAVQKSATAGNVFFELSSKYTGPQVKALEVKDQAQNIADLRTLFDSLDFCDCTECRSVLSPAAYLVDVLEFIRHRQATPNPDGDLRWVRDILFRRRPDIGEIELTCENTNTLVPYLDLVNELLEEAVAPAVPPGQWGHLPPTLREQFQTRLSTEELSASPEHINTNAYRLLSGALYPWSLPFDLWMEETRVNLNQLGTSRANLIRMFRPLVAMGDPASIAIAQETLGLTTSGWNAIVNSSLSNITADWGGPAGDLAHVPRFLERSGLSYEELTELLDTRYVNKGTRPVLIAPLGSCDLDEMWLTQNVNTNPADTTLDPSFLSRTHRFVRLWRTMGWTMRELDSSIVALGATDLDWTFLLRLSDLIRVQSRLLLSREQSLTFYGNIETFGPNALYETIFRNPRLLTQFWDPAFLPETILNPGTIPRPLTAHTATILAALDLTEQELATLLQLLRDSLPSHAEPELTLGTLSFLYRHTLLGKVLHLTTAELVALLRLIGIDPFNRADINGTLGFVDAVEAIRSSAFSINELGYLFEGRPSAPLGFEPTTESITRVLGSILESLANLEHTASRALQTHLVAQRLSEALNLSLEIVTSLLTQYLCAAGTVGHNPNGTAVHPMIEDFLDPVFMASTRPFTAVHDAQTTSYRLLHKATLLLSKFGISEVELWWLFNPVDQTDRGLDLNLLPRVGTSAYRTPEGFGMWSRIGDLVRLRNRSGTEKLEAVLANAARQAPGGTGAVSISLPEAISLLGPWRLGDVRSIIDHLGFTLVTLGGERALTQLSLCCDMASALGVSAERCWTWATPSLSALEARTVAQEIREAVKARYSNDQWLTIAKPLRDTLRVKQTKALVSYLLVHPPAAYQDADPAIGLPWNNVDDLYAYFLVDVEMGACAMTSRIKLALSSVQLFIQRCLLAIEPEVRPNTTEDSTWLQWGQSMKNYRVWEANRNIFLYPENWIEPELRDDKTPLFEAFEHELLQNDPTSETTEAAFANYFETLDTIARPEISAMYRQPNDPLRPNDPSILHVFGRTRGTPHVYYYRRQVPIGVGSNYWTPWEKVNVDIEGDYLVPVVWNGRLYLFWPVLTEQTERQGLEIPGQSVGLLTAPRKNLKMKLAWSQYRNQRWTAKTISQELASIPSDDSVDFYFQAVPTNQDLDVKCTTRIRSGFKFAPWNALVAYLPDPFYRVVSPPVAVTKQIKFRFSGSDGSVRLIPLASPEGPNPFDQVYLWGTHLEGTAFVEDPHGRSFPSIESFDAFQNYLRNLYQLTFHRFLGPGSGGGGVFGYTESIRLDAAQSIVPLNAAPSSSDGGDVWESVDLTSLVQDANRRDGDTSVRLTGQRLTQILQALPLNQTFQTVLAESIRSNREMRIQERVILKRTSGIPTRNFFRILLPPKHNLPIEDFCFQDDKRTFFAKLINGKYEFTIHYHPFVKFLMQTLNRDGIDGLMQRDVQRFPLGAGLNFASVYNPNLDLVHLQEHDPSGPLPLGPREDMDFSSDGAYAQYNWELFFHAPLLIADKLKTNQRFAEAQKWYHYIFDPTDPSPELTPSRYWRTLPFFKQTSDTYHRQQIDALMLGVAQRNAELNNQVQQWRQNPFNPHLVARMRTTAFQRTVVMKYIDNLIAWGDQLFRQDTLETINEATQLYMLASEILGPRPVNVRPRTRATVQTHYSIQPELDSFSNALVRAENILPPALAPARLDINLPGLLDFFLFPNQAPPRDPQWESPAYGHANGPPVFPTTLYFCVPPNNKLLAFWYTVADRLFKVRHCMNFEGVVRELPLFDVPIDSELLARAHAAGVDIGSLLTEASADTPLIYRFAVLAQKAGELCADVRGLGAALLSAFQARDAEAFALLRSGHELAVLSQMQQIKEYQIEEAVRALEGMRKSRETTILRRDHYASMEFMNQGEQVHLDLMTQSLVFQHVATELELVGSVLTMIPNFKIAFLTSAGGTFGGGNLGPAVQGIARYIGAQGSMLGASGAISATLAGYQRRQEEWQLQVRLANKELEQIEKQIIAAEIRVAIAQKDLQMHLLHAEQTREADSVLRSKFTNRELYDWLVAQLSDVYFQSYRMAFDMAKRAERAFQFERGIETSAFITFGHWDSLRNGLLAGERLHMDLKRLEIEYINQNKRDFELTRNISLALHDPFALHALRTTGRCTVNLPESLFDHDHPGHYMRRIKSVALTLPAVVGPYTSVNCRLTLRSSFVRFDPAPASHYRPDPDMLHDGRFRNDLGSVQSIATSRAHSDTGMFEVNFRDERYLPFEGAGVISRWELDLDPRCNDFDLSTLSDVVMELRYTARDGGDDLRNPCLTEMTASSHEPHARLFSARTDFADAWNEFLYPISNTPGQTLTLDIDKNRFGFRAQQGTIAISEIHVVLMLSEEGALAYPSGGLRMVITDPNLRTVTPGPTVTPPSPAGLALPAGTTPGTRDIAGGFVSLTPAGGVGQWKINLPDDVLTLPAFAGLLAPIVSGSHARLAPEMVEDLLVFVVY